MKEGYSFKVSDVDVEFVYSDGSRAECGAYSLTQTKQGGSYLITIAETKYNKYTTTLTVTMISPVLKSIKAEYTGPTVGSVSEVKETYFKVTGTYDDGTTKVLGTYSISVNGTVVNGSYTATITSAGLSTTVAVPTTDTGSGSGTTKTVKDITATTALTSVNVGYTFKTSDFTVKYVYEDDSTDDCGSFSIDVAQSGETYQITVKDTKYGYTKQLTVKAVSPTLKSISANYNGTAVSSISEVTKDKFTVNGTYSDGSTKALTSYTYKVTGPSDGYYTATFTSGSITTSVLVPATSSEPTLSKLSAGISGSVNVNENLAPGQLIVKATYSDGSEKDVTASATCDFTPKANAGNYKANVSYGGLTVSLTVKVVVPKTVTGMTATCKRSSVVKGYEFDADDFDVKYQYSDGTTADCVYYFNYELSGGWYFITIKDITEKYTEELSVRVVTEGEPTLLSIAAVYNKDGASDMSGIAAKDFTVTGTYDDGSTKQITNFGVSTDNRTEAYGYYVVTVTAGSGVTTTVKVDKK